MIWSIKQRQEEENNIFNINESNNENEKKKDFMEKI